MRPRLTHIEGLDFSTETFYHPVGDDRPRTTGYNGVSDSFDQIMDSGAIQSKARRQDSRPEKYGWVEDALLLDEDVEPEDIIDTLKRNEGLLRQQGHESTVSAFEKGNMERYEDLGLLPRDMDSHSVHFYPKRQDAMLKAQAKHAGGAGGFCTIEVPSEAVISTVDGDRPEGRIPGKVPASYVTNVHIADNKDNLEELESGIEEVFGVQPETYPADLTEQ